MVSSDISYLEFYNRKPLYLHVYIAPFVLLYLAWLYWWNQFFGLEHWELGCIGVVIITVCQILCSLFCLWSVHFFCWSTCYKIADASGASYVKTVPIPNHGSPEFVPLHHEKDGTIWFLFQKQKYIQNGEKSQDFAPIEFPIFSTIDTYMEAKGYADDKEINIAASNYGLNKLQMDIPSFMELFKERATAPFFVFQVFCVGLWCLDEYWYYSLFTLVMLVIFEVTLVQQQLRNMSEIRKMGNKPYLIDVYRNRKWRSLMSDELLPGDLVTLVRSQDDRLIPCDILLLRGTCIVDESMLTGESVPVMKEPVENLSRDQTFQIDTDGKLHVLYGGTKVVQHAAAAKVDSNIKAHGNGCLGYVLRTSFNTSQGQLLKTILFGVKPVSANNMETFMFILFLLIFAIIAAVYVWVKGTADVTRNRYKLFLECTLILTSVVPPELPIELSLAVNTSLMALSKLLIFCTEPFRIPFAGKVDVCCFDKTGTLTSDLLVVEGVAGLHPAAHSVVPVNDCPTNTVHVLATCHSLVQLDNDTIGDPLEKAALQAIDWNVTKGEAVVPRKGKGHGLKIFQRFHFASALKRMSVIAGYTAPGAADTDYIVAAKGAPEVLKEMLTSVPPYYDEVYLKLARRGARVLTLAYRSLGQLNHQDIRSLSRQYCEQQLTFAGFLIISCPLKRDSPGAVWELLGSSHHVVMITGDNVLTACHVAKELRMASKQHTLVLMPPNSVADQWHWESVDQTVVLPFETSPSVGFKQMVHEHDLALTGDGMEYIVKAGGERLFERILPHVCVFARVGPKQKERVVLAYKNIGMFTLMCGDGTNDVGALKHAHCGVALLTHGVLSAPAGGAPPRPIQAPAQPEAAKLRKPPAVAERDRSRPPGAPAVKQADQPRPASQMLLKAMQELEAEETHIVRLGDASIASPFTSKKSTPQAVCDIVRQGRCTLVTTLQMYKILALNALILAYSQSVLYLEGVKFSDTQATLQGMLLAGCFLFICRSKPLQTLSVERPLPTIFNVYTLLSVFLQFTVHFGAIVFLYDAAKTRSPPRNETFVDLHAKFEPSLINTTIYLISVSMQVSTFAVNHKGHPFMEKMSDNRPLLYSLVSSLAFTFALASGYIPDIAAQFEIVELPADFRFIVIQALAFDLVAAWCLDRLCALIFGRSPQRIGIR